MHIFKLASCFEMCSVLPWTEAELQSPLKSMLHLGFHFWYLNCNVQSAFIIKSNLLLYTIRFLRFFWYLFIHLMISIYNKWIRYCCNSTNVSYNAIKLLCIYGTEASLWIVPFQSNGNNELKKTLHCLLIILSQNKKQRVRDYIYKNLSVYRYYSATVKHNLLKPVNCNSHTDLNPKKHLHSHLPCSRRMCNWVFQNLLHYEVDNWDFERHFLAIIAQIVMKFGTDSHVPLTIYDIYDNYANTHKN